MYRFICSFWVWVWAWAGIDLGCTCKNQSLIFFFLMTTIRSTRFHYSSTMKVQESNDESDMVTKKVVDSPPSHYCGNECQASLGVNNTDHLIFALFVNGNEGCFVPSL